MFCSNFSRVRMFCDDDHSKLVSESTRPGVFLGWLIADNLHKKLKSEDLLLKRKLNSKPIIYYTLGSSVLNYLAILFVF